MKSGVGSHVLGIGCDEIKGMLDIFDDNDGHAGRQGVPLA